MEKYTKRQTENYLLNRMLRAWSILPSDRKDRVLNAQGKIATWEASGSTGEVREEYPRGIMVGR